MTKAQIIDSVLINLLGGQVTGDANLWQSDLEAYLPIALARAVRMDHFERRAELRRDAQLAFQEEFFPNLEFYKSIEVTPLQDPDSGYYYVSLPKLLDLDYGWNIRTPRLKHSYKVSFQRLREWQMLIGAEDLGLFYWLEVKDSDTRLYFSHMPPPIQPVIVYVITDPFFEDEDEEMPYTKNQLFYATQLMLEYFRAQRGTPTDRKQDHQDINETTV